MDAKRSGKLVTRYEQSRLRLHLKVLANCCQAIMNY